MFDIFYSGKKPNLFAHEQQADSIEHAQKLSRTRYFWWVTYLADFSTWDFLWEPAPWQSHQRHAWPSQWQRDSAVYLVPKNWDGKDTNYHTAPTLRRFPDINNWKIYESIDESSWDWSWHPDALEPPYIYVFSNQWNNPEVKASVEYHVPGATECKYMDQRTQRLPQKHLFENKIAVSQFDYSWEPNPFDPPYIYVFGNTWYSAEKEPSVTYTVPGATEVKYVHDIVAQPCGSPADYELLHEIDPDKFDWSWHPDPNDPPYIYVFGNQWYPAEIMPTLKYHVEGATEIKYMDAPRATLNPNKSHTHILVEGCEWDYSWVPDPGDPPYIYVFGNQWWPAEKWPTVEYRVPGATERKYMTEPVARLPSNSAGWNNLVSNKYTFDYSWQPDPGDQPYRYVFGNQWHSAEIMPTLEWVHPDANESTPTKYVDWPRAELLPDVTNWTLPTGVNPDTVDFSWIPDPGEPPYIYQFATQHQKTGGPVYTVPGATEIKYLEHIEIKIEVETVPIVEIDHMDGNAGKIPGAIRKVRFFDNYRDTLIRLAKSLQGEHEFVWVCSSVCDYTDFDFTWHPEKWQSTMLHVFPSNDQKFGDTFYMHVPTFAERAEKKALMEWYSVNFVARKPVSRRPMPVIEHKSDSHVDAIMNTDWAGPLALFTVNGRPMTEPTVSLWREETRTVVPLSLGASAVIVPKAAKGSIKTQLYDYAYIDKTNMRRAGDQPLDIVFISNGEYMAEQHFEHLLDSTYNKNNLVHRVDGVNGRAAAYHAAARKSTTPWFFAVFAKLHVRMDFPWDWQPDRMQQPKHYIFHAFNPVNELEYGHQAMIAYNQNLVLNNPGHGLDFTLDSAHEVVPIRSGIAHYTDTPWMAWRTAFREVLKLRASMPDVESEYRLNAWLSKDNTEGNWSRKGAEDAVAYYEEVQGDFDALKKSYEWDWLASYAFVRRNLTPE